MGALNRKLRALAFSGKARSRAAADLEAFVRDRERAEAEKAWDELAEYVATKDGGASEGEFLKEQNPYRKAVQS